MTLPVRGGDNLTENYVGANFANYDYYIVLSHFKGHSMAGYGGAIKNISIGIASSEGKEHIHSGGTGGSIGWRPGRFSGIDGRGGKVGCGLSGRKYTLHHVMNRRAGIRIPIGYFVF